jgi:hypothetical protein
MANRTNFLGITTADIPCLKICPACQAKVLAGARVQAGGDVACLEPANSEKYVHEA